MLLLNPFYHSLLGANACGGVGGSRSHARTGGGRGCASERQDMSLMEQRLEQVAFREVLRLKAQLITREDDDGNDGAGATRGQGTCSAPGLVVVHAC